MPQFLTNPKAVTEGKKYIKVLQDSALFLRADETTTPPVKDADGVEWFKVLANSWVQESDVEAFCQYDLMKLGFMPLEENTAGDVTEHVYEPWVQQAFSGIAKLASEAPGMDYARVPMAYQNLGQQ
jgi:hypothetical protein